MPVNVWAPTLKDTFIGSVVSPKSIVVAFCAARSWVSSAFSKFVWAVSTAPSRVSYCDFRPFRSFIFDERSASSDAREEPAPVVKKSASAASALPLAATRFA